MKLLVVVMLGLMAFAPARAQDDSALRNELNQEIDLLLPKVKLRKKTKREHRAEGIKLVSTSNAEAGNSSTTGNTNLNNSESAATAGNNTSVNVQVTEQPPSTVEAAPLNESRLDRLKKNRQEMERQNEEKLVERIESDRIEREQKRAAKTNTLTFEEKALRDAEKSIEVNQVQAKDTTIIAPVQVQEAPAPKQVVEIKPAKADSVSETNIDIGPPTSPDLTRWFIAANGGLGQYAAQNVSGVWAAGFTFGLVLPDRIIVESGILFSSYDVIALPTGYYNDIYARTIQMEQRNYYLGAKYQFTRSRIRPVAGVMVSYTTREFQDPLMARPGSQGFDAGLSAGADLALNEQFSLGADIKYYMNLSTRRDNMNTVPTGYGYAYGYGPYPGVQGGKYIDELNYYVLGINAQFRF